MRYLPRAMRIPSQTRVCFPKLVVRERPSDWAGGPRAAVDETWPEQSEPWLRKTQPELIADSRASMALHNV
eukprot:6767335-Pyramimonas_sp.AAC.1